MLGSVKKWRGNEIAKHRHRKTKARSVESPPQKVGAKIRSRKPKDWRF